MKAGASILALAFGGAVGLAAIAPLNADPRSPLSMNPLMAASVDAGTKHVLSYFQTSDGQCKLTLMLSDQARDDDARASESGTRFQVVVDAGGTARVDTAKGKSVEFACKPDARSMTARVVDRVALYQSAE
jgi:hypothetical protein